MIFKKIWSITEARKNLFSMAKDVQKPGVKYLLTEKGKPKIVVMSYDEFDSLMETQEVLSDPGLVKSIRESEKAIKDGKLDNFVPLEDLLDEFGMEDIYKKKKNVSGHRSKKGKKRAEKNRWTLQKEDFASSDNSSVWASFG